MEGPILVVLAAGMGSRYGGLKQMDPIDGNNHAILDYSVYDAWKAGFKKVVFIIKHAIEKDFKEMVGKRIEGHIDVEYVFQELDKIPEPFRIPEGREKPFGTGHALLCAKGAIDAPFAVINADDYYGKEAYVKLHEFLSIPQQSNAYAMAGFILKNTLSENGGVTRGICQVDAEGFLTDVVETKNIRKTSDGAEVEGVSVNPESHVSMNMWALQPGFMELLEQGFREFFADAVAKDPIKAEYLLPIYIGQLLREDKVSVRVLETGEKWFGVTYREDKPAVVESFRELINQGVYSTPLFEKN